MSRSKQTVEYLAREASTDPEEALIRLWDGGIGYPKSIGSKIRTDDFDIARRLLGLLCRGDLAVPEAWQEHLGLNDEEFRELGNSLGLEYTQSGRLRGKSTKRLEAHANNKRRNASDTASIEIRRNLSSANSKLAAKVEYPPLVWAMIGQPRDIKHLSHSDVETIHAELVDFFLGQDDPIDPPGIRDINLLASAVERTKTSLGEELKYPTVEMAAAALLHSLIHNHPFHNGNKRTALVAMLAFLDINGVLFTCSEQETFLSVLSVAQHSVVPKCADHLWERETIEIAKWISRYTRRIEYGDRPVPFRKLRKLFVRYDCEFRMTSSGDYEISRELPGKRGLFGRKR